MVNKNNLVVISFTSPNGETCNVDNQPQPAAYFTLVPGPMPTPAPATSHPTVPNVQDIISSMIPHFN
jgi:hypothetical protein